MELVFRFLVFPNGMMYEVEEEYYINDYVDDYGNKLSDKPFYKGKDFYIVEQIKVREERRMQYVYYILSEGNKNELTDELFLSYVWRYFNNKK